MSLMYVIKDDVSSPVNLPANDFTSFVPSGPCFSGLRIGADGNLYERHPTGGWSRYGTWLFTGTSDTYYVARTITSGTLTTDAGAGPLQLNVDRDYDVQTSSGEEFTTVQFDISDDVGGANILTSIVYIFNAISGSN